MSKARNDWELLKREAARKIETYIMAVDRGIFPDGVEITASEMELINDESQGVFEIMSKSYSLGFFKACYILLHDVTMVDLLRLINIISIYDDNCVTDGDFEELKHTRD